MSETSPSENTNDKQQEPSLDKGGKSGEQTQLKRYLRNIFIGIVVILAWTSLEHLIFRETPSLYVLVLGTVYGALGGVAYSLWKKS